MIRSCGSKAAGWLSRRERVHSIDPRIHRVPLRMLRQVGSAERLEDLRIPPGNRFQAHEGRQGGQYSIRFNEQWPICFVWTIAGPEKVEIVVCH